MSKSTKAALFSGLGFPGLGHLYLKSYPRAISLITIVVISIAVYVAEAIKQSQKVLQEIEASGKILSVEEMTELTSEALKNTDTLLLSAAGLAFIGCWAFGVIDSYRLGKKQYG